MLTSKKGLEVHAFNMQCLIFSQYKPRNFDDRLSVDPQLNFTYAVKHVYNGTREG